VKVDDVRTQIPDNSDDLQPEARALITPCNPWKTDDSYPIDDLLLPVSRCNKCNIVPSLFECLALLMKKPNIESGVKGGNVANLHIFFLLIARNA
jgi:hypothetical protein